MKLIVAPHGIHIENGWQKDSRRMGSQKDSRLIGNGWLTEAKRIAEDSSNDD